MRNQEQQNNNANIEENKNDAFLLKLNQSLLTQSYFILFVIIVLSLLANTTRGYDYNVVVGCGIYFLSTKNPLLHKMFYFYLLVGLTICADGIIITLLFNKVSIFNSLIVPVLSILLKLLLLILEAVKWIIEKKEQNQRKLVSKEEPNPLEEIERKKIQEANIAKYLDYKQSIKPKPGSYYKQKHSNFNKHPAQQSFTSQAYKEFNQQEFIEDSPVHN